MKLPLPRRTRDNGKFMGKSSTHLVDIIALQCSTHAEKIAILEHDRSITYSQLNAAADDFAAELHARGVAVGDLVCLIGQRSIELAIAALAVWRCGAAYVPISGDSPRERIALILAQTQCRVAVELTGRCPTPGVESWGETSQCSVLPLRMLPASSGRHPPRRTAESTDLAYVIFTSGTTGEPKGVMIGHDTLAAVVEAYCAHFEISSTDRVSAVANIAFDASVIEFWPALSRGATVCVTDPDTVRSPRALMHWIDSQAISFSWLPTPLVEVLIADDELQPPSCLRMIETAGQRLLRRPRGWRVPLRNSYGPTEATVIATSSLVVAESSDSDRPPDIGRPLAGVEVYLLDAQMRAVAPGEVGEMYIGGIGVARGYWRQPELTASKFVADPFSAGTGRRLYATGDLCRFNRHGNLEFVGRIDDQVKLRGHRVELGEIEHALIGIDGVVQAACLVAELRGAPRLVAYCVLRPHFRFDQEMLRAQVARTLPDYMLPDVWVALDTLPQTSNGKTDRKRLPLPDEKNGEQVLADGLDQNQCMFFDWYAAVTRLTIGWDQDFFHAGGNSIDAILFLESLRREREVDLDYACFVQASSPASLYERVAGGAGRLDNPNRTIIAARPCDPLALTPLSNSQRSVWFLANLEPQGRAYHAKARLLFQGTLCARTLRDALQDIVDRHEIFRTSFVQDDGSVLQQVHSNFQIELPEIDLSDELAMDASEEEMAAALDRLLLGELNRPFALDRLPLVRWALVRLPRRRFALLHIEHHLVHDGWSHNLFVGELLAHYTRRLKNADAACTDAPPLQYADFSVAQAKWLQSPEAIASEAYWCEKLRGAPAVIALPTNGDPGAADGATLRHHLDRARWRRIEAACREQGHTPFAFMLAAFSYVLARASGDDDVCIGSAFANRSWAGASGVIGMMINTVVLRMRMNEEDRVSDLLARSASVCTEAQTHQAFPFESLVRALNPQREPTTNPLFQTFLGFHDSPLPAMVMPGIDSVELKEAIDSSAAKFDLSLVVIPRKGQEGVDDPVHMLWEYKRSRFAPWFIEVLVGALETVIDAFLDTPERILQEVPIAPGAQACIPVTCEPDADAARPVVSRILDRARMQPDAVAIEFNGHQQDYAELSASILAKAGLLQAQGVRGGDRIAVCLERGPELVAWLLAVQWVGAAYIPLDPAYPVERLRYIVEHSRPLKLVADTDAGRLIAPELLLQTKSDAFASTAPSPLATVSASDTAYVIYTSGSTGRPKGVVVGHENLASFMVAMESLFPLTPGARWLAVTSCAFDISILELFLPLVRGATVVLASEDDARDAGRLAALLSSSRTSHLQATPATWRALVDTDWRAPPEFVGLCGGEALDAALARQCLARGVRLYNLYGPTETTIWSCVHEVTEVEASVPIGRPLVNTEAFVLDRRRRMVPHGAIGELWLGGDGVSHGYLHAPELTAERFIDHPFGGTGRLYATGDMVSADAEDRLCFHGRNDHQIKIRGFRIELGEVEATLRELTGVSNAVVTVCGKGGEVALAAYYVAAEEITDGDLARHCARELPQYMLPTHWIRLPELPLTPNGKLDRAALPAPDRRSPATRMTPVGPVECAIAAIYSELLGVAAPDAGEGFLALGGHSLLGMRAVAKINRRFQVDLAVVEFFRLSTIQAVAAEVEARAPRSAVFVEEIIL